MANKLVGSQFVTLPRDLPVRTASTCRTLTSARARARARASEIALSCDSSLKFSHLLGINFD